MSRTLVEIGRQIRGAQGLQTVVRTMKTLALISLGPFESATAPLDAYAETVDHGLRAALAEAPPHDLARLCAAGPGPVGAIVFGTDHGMAADFNDRLARFAQEQLAGLPAGCIVWPVGERVAARLADFAADLAPARRAPETVETVPGLLSQLVGDVAARCGMLAAGAAAAGGGGTATGVPGRIVAVYQMPVWGVGAEPVIESLLPLASDGLARVLAGEWPSRRRPEAFHDADATLTALLREHLFVSLFRACVRSAAAEHSVRLAAMQRAERNIGDLLEGLGREFNEQRQATISEELFDIVAGFEAVG